MFIEWAIYLVWPPRCHLHPSSQCVVWFQPRALPMLDNTEDESQLPIEAIINSMAMTWCCIGTPHLTWSIPQMPSCFYLHCMPILILHYSLGKISPCIWHCAGIKKMLEYEIGAWRRLAVGFICMLCHASYWLLYSKICIYVMLELIWKFATSLFPTFLSI